MKKICLLGEPAVGKTSLIARFVENRFDEKYISTIGTRISKKQIIYEPEDLLPEQEELAQEPVQEAQLQSPPAYQQAPEVAQYPYQQAPQVTYPYQQPPQQSPPTQFQQQVQPTYPAQPVQSKKSFWERFKDLFKRKKPAQTQYSYQTQYHPGMQPAQPIYQQSQLPAHYQPYQPQPDAQPIQPAYQQPIQPPAAHQPAQSYQQTQPSQTQPEKKEQPEPVTLNLAIWDILGQEHATHLQQSFYRGAEGALLVCDCSRPETAERLPKWVENLYAVEDSIPIIFLGNKYDLIEGTDSVNYMEELLKELGNKFNAPWHFTSAKTGHYVEESFKELGKKMVG